jgi:uncharacterized membrane protein
VSCVAASTLGDLLELATEQISRYGSAEPTVITALVRLCGSVERLATSAVERASAQVVRDYLMSDVNIAATGERTGR